MAEPVRLAIIGTGRMGALHARSLAETDAINVVAVADSVSEVARGIAREIRAVPHVGTAGLLDHDLVEAWLIATPTPTHPRLTRAALEAGLHVLCEKPLSFDPGVSRALGRLAGRCGLVLQVGFWRRFSPPWVAAKRLIDGGAIGRPLMLRLAQWDADPPPPAFCDPAVSGGLAVDCGVHEFDLAEWLTGCEVEQVTARSLPIVDPAVAEAGDIDNLVALLDMSDGGAAMVDLSRNARYGSDVRTEILGEDGAVFVDLLPKGETRLARADGVVVVPDSVVQDGTVAGIVAQAEGFAAAIRGADIDVPGAHESGRAVAVARAVQASAASASSIRVVDHAC